MANAKIETGSVTTSRHTTHYLAAGPADGPLIIFVHGWPELSLSWRHQLPVFGDLGFRAIAPDMRGYGQSSVYDTHDAYAQREVVADMLELIDSFGRDRAVWVGHDWGSPTVWNIARLHPDRCRGVASLCVPYFSVNEGPEGMLALVNRDIYPQAEYPYGQWDYMVYYQENFERATKVFDADPYLTMKLLLRKGDPTAAGTPSMTASVRSNGGWFGPLDAAPDMPMDSDVVSEADLQIYARSLRKNSFFGPDSYYMNTESNSAFVADAPENLELPTLFLHGRYDYVCETVESRLAEPMRKRCKNLTEVIVESGHWMAQEQPRAVNAALANWLATQIGEFWPHPASALRI
jgi:soluble epoxide hydrolase / lipid-phosphate phosphatase